MKQCHRCEQWKDESDYHVNGTDQYCKQCRKEVNRINYEKRKNTPLEERGEPSTRLGMKLLAMQGIPTTFGINTIVAWSDAMAWGCIPIEIKYSKAYDINAFRWKFTDKQLSDGYHSGLFMFIADYDEVYRVFIIPCNTDWLTDNGKPKMTAFKCVIGSDHFNATNWELLEPYENRYDLIEKLRLEYSEKLKSR